MAEINPVIINLLRRQYIFHGLTDDQLAQVAGKFTIADYERDQPVFAQGDKGDSFYIVMKGRLRATRHTRGGERLLHFLTLGDFFGEEALLFDRPRSTSVYAMLPSRILRLDRADFSALLDEFPLMRLNLSATAESRTLARRQNFDWLWQDEVIYLIARKHIIFLWFWLLPAFFVMLWGIRILVGGVTHPDPAAGQVETMIGLFVLGLVALWSIWFGLDWSNDFYIVTNRRVIWLEKLLFLYDSRRESPLENILTVETASSQLGRIVGYGTVIVRTFTGAIVMRRMAHPDRFVQFTQGFRDRTRQLSREAEDALLEGMLRQRLGLPVVDEPVQASRQRLVTQRRRKVTAKPGTFRHRLETFLKVRYEEGNVITYRKHWLVLLKKTGVPGAILLGETLFFGYLIMERILNGLVIISGPIAWLFSSLLFLITFLWWGYHYLDWSNDIYRLTPEQIFDIEKRPLGREEKKVANLDNILSLDYVREGIVQLIFNYGTVNINVGQEKFIFHGVYNPDQVQMDIADYMQARKQKKDEDVQARDRQRMVDVLLMYRGQTHPMDQMENRPDWDISLPSEDV